jgi:tRNA threonylcarbamoyladenosine modification (KEOPS) complex Cgi121 subunit
MQYSEKLLDKLRNKLSEEAYYSLINIKLANQAGLRALITAHLESYLATQRGATISKIRGIDTILYILGTRNIREALKANRLEEGATIVLVVASPSTALFQELRSMINESTVECRIPVTGSIELSSVALFPIEARVYRSMPA